MRGVATSHEGVETQTVESRPMQEVDGEATRTDAQAVSTKKRGGGTGH